MKLSEAKKTPYAGPGGYGLLALMDDGGILCHHCLSTEENVHEDDSSRDGWGFVNAFIHWEGPSITCDHCGNECSSEYGDPEEEEEQHDNHL